MFEQIFLVDNKAANEDFFFLILWFGGAMLNNFKANLIIYMIVSIFSDTLLIFPLEILVVFAQNEKRIKLKTTIDNWA